MEDPPSMTLSQPQKRPFEDEAPVSTPIKAPPSDASPLSTPLTVLSTIPSPIKPASPITNDAPTSSSTPTGSQPAKRRKLTEKEKEEKRLEQDAKEKAKAEKKAKKEEEQRAKDEEKRKKNEEREEKKRAKELAQQQKEEDKRKKEEEKHKKEQAQLRLNAFFVKKPTETTPMVDSTEATAAEALLKPDIPLQEANIAPVSPQKAIHRKAQNDYDRVFLPFQVPSHTILAPYNRFMADPDTLTSAASRLEKVLATNGSNTAPVEDIAAFKSRFPKRSRGMKSSSIIDIVERINGSSNNPIDLTDDMTSNGSRQEPLEQLRHIPMKYLHFPEDVRPPYYGTYTKPQPATQTSRLARCPFSRSLKETNYDYDSEAEWEEPQEGDEDLDSEGDDDLDEDADEDMDGFLDDEDDPQVKRRLLNGDMEPVSTGLCWEDPRGVSRLNDGSGAICTDFKEFRMGFLLPQSHPIDPFSTAYWAPNPATVIATLPTKDNTIVGMMNPPTRMPLTQRPVNGMLNTINSSDKHGITGLPKGTKAGKRLVPPDQMPSFKKAIDGSDLTKIALIEHLKKQFPKLTKDAISNTLSAVAARVGPKEVEKRWVLNPE